MRSTDGEDSGGSTPCDAGLLAARERTVQAVRALMAADPEGWPEHLAHVAGAACGLHCESMDLLVDAANQVAGMAHRLEAERREAEDGPSMN